MRLEKESTIADRMTAGFRPRLSITYAEQMAMEIPFSFSQFPYPLNPSATISFTLEEQQEISLRIYNTFGQVVQVLYEDVLMKPGYHELRLYGETFPSGGCYARLQTKYGVQQRTLVLNTSTP